MRVTLIHNPGAGGPGQPDAKQLRKLIKAAGHKLRYHSSKDGHLSAVLKKKADMVAVAGGDGTVSRVARRLAGRNLPLAVLPFGTANNIARSLGLIDIPIEQNIRAWERAPRIRMDTARARGPWGNRRFVEGLGIGLFAWTMPHASDSRALAKIDKPEKAVAHALKMVQDRLQHYKAHDLEVTLDGRDLSDRYVMFEAMNLQYIGPNLHLAPRVEPGDGLLHIVMVREAQRDKLRRYLERWQKGIKPRVKLPTVKGKHLKIKYGDYHVHVDDRIWPDPRARRKPRRADIEVKVDPGTIEFILPKARNA
jgi:diacylglycerol kinase family enzyme